MPGLAHRLYEALFHPDPPSVRALARRVEALEDEIPHLQARLNKLQGRVYGGDAHKRPEPGAAAPIPEDVDALNEAIKSGQLMPEAKGVKRGVLRNVS